MSLAARAFRPGDAGALAALHRAAFDDPQLGPAYWRQDRNDPPNLCTVAERDGVPLAYCDGFLAGEGGDVGSVGTLPEARGQGAARAAMILWLAEAARRGASVIHLEVGVTNAPALALYQRLGFERVGARTSYYADGTDAAVLACQLEACQLEQAPLRP